MADTLSRSQLIQQQIENLQRNAPPPVTQAERDQIMKGRKGQKDIDAGRAAIDARAKEVSDHTAKIDKLMTDLGEAQKQENIDTEKAKREAGADPIKNIAIPAGVGAAGGGIVSYGLNKVVHGGAKDRANAIIEIGKEIGPTKDLTNSQINLSRAMGAAKAAEKYTPSTLAGKLGQVGGRVATYGVPVGALGYEFSRYNKIAEDESRPWEERQAAARMANGFLGAFSGIGVEGAARAFNSKIQPGEGEAMMRVEAARDFARRMDARNAAQPAQERMPASPLARALQAQTIDAEAIPVETPPKALPSPAAAPEAIPAPEAETPPNKTATPGTKAYMQQQARDLKIKGYSTMDKPTLAQALADAMAEHGGKRTRAPRVPGGGGKAAILGPAIAAGTAYLAGTDRADAGDGSQKPSTLAETLTPPAAAAAATYGGSKLIDAMGAAGKIAGGMMDPVASMSIDPLEGATREESAQNIARARGQASYYAPGLAEKVLGVPRSEGTAYDITQNEGNMPSANPLRTTPSPGNQYYPSSSPVMGSPAEQSSQPSASGLPPVIEAKIRRMVSMGATPQQVASWLNAAAPQ